MGKKKWKFDFGVNGDSGVIYVGNVYGCDGWRP